MGSEMNRTRALGTCNCSQVESSRGSWGRHSTPTHAGSRWESEDQVSVGVLRQEFMNTYTVMIVGTLQLVQWMRCAASSFMSLRVRGSGRGDVRNGGRRRF